VSYFLHLYTDNCIYTDNCKQVWNEYLLHKKIFIQFNALRGFFDLLNKKKGVAVTRGVI
jgi:hypothetical protein